MRPAGTSLIIRPGAGRKLSRTQRAFNRLIARLDELGTEIPRLRARLDLLLDRHNERVAPLQAEYARRQLELARALSRTADDRRLGVRSRNAVGRMIVDLCREAFHSITPAAEDERLHDAWSSASYQEERRKQAQEERRRIAEEARDTFGVDVDPHVHDDSEEGMARFLHGVRERVREAQQEAHAHQAHARTKRKGRRQQENNSGEAPARRPLRDVFRSLAKILHPDAVGDSDERARREEAMKLATAAYRTRDVGTLLRLDLTWNPQTRSPESAPDDVLAGYLPALKDQVAALEDELTELPFDPRYQPVAYAVMTGERRADAEISTCARALRSAIVEMKHDVEFVRNEPSKQALDRMVREYLHHRDREAAMAEAFEVTDDF